MDAITDSSLSKLYTSNFSVRLIPFRSKGGPRDGTKDLFYDHSYLTVVVVSGQLR